MPCYARPFPTLGRSFRETLLHVCNKITAGSGRKHSTRDYVRELPYMISASEGVMEKRT